MQNKSLASMLEQLFIKYRNQMYYIAYSILHNESQAEDAVGDGYERLIPYLNQSEQEEEQKLKVLLTVLVKNAAIDIYRKNRRESVYPEWGECMEKSFLPMEEYMNLKEYQDYIQQIQQQIPENYWEVLRMRYLQGLSVSEISEVTGMKTDNIYTRLRRARRMAREVLGEEAYQVVCTGGAE